MNTLTIPHLRRSLRDILQGAADYHEVMAIETGEAFHVVNRIEFMAGLAALDTPVDRQDRFVDHGALVIVRECLDGYLATIADDLLLTKRPVQSLLHLIDTVEQTAFLEDRGGA